MGTELSDMPTADVVSPVVALSRTPWLDARSAALMRAIIEIVARQHHELCAAILYGSVARHDERPLADPDTSDVDLLLLFGLPKGEEDIPFPLYRAIFASIGQARQQYPYPPREVQVLPLASHLPGSDSTFIANVARDGLLLWSRGPLPDALAAVWLGAAPTDHGGSSPAPQTTPA